MKRHKGLNNVNYNFIIAMFIQNLKILVWVASAGNGHLSMRTAMVVGTPEMNDLCS